MVGNKLIFQADTSTYLEHPAVVAWHKFAARTYCYSSVERLTTREGMPHNRKSAVYRIKGCGANDESVIAKRAKREGVEIERLLYQEILPMIPISSPHCYGVMHEEGGFSWLFMEEVHGDCYDEESAEHRSLAGKWLGVVHQSSIGPAVIARLPAVGADKYLSLLQEARTNIINHLICHNIDASERLAFCKILDLYAAIESQWKVVEAFCSTIPPCLVHGDFIAKNIRIGDGKMGPALYAIDWEAAGWGIPAEDLGGLDQTIADHGGEDLMVYWLTVKETWSHLDLDVINRLVAIGTIFRYLAWITAASAGFSDGWAEKAAQKIRTYSEHLSQARQMAAL